MGKAEPIELSGDLLFQGVLMKQQKLLRSYVSRWFLLRKDGCLISLDKMPAKTDIIGMGHVAFNIEATTEVTVVQKKKGSFILTSGGQELILPLVAPDDAQREQWVNIIMQLRRVMASSAIAHGELSSPTLDLMKRPSVTAGTMEGAKSLDFTAVGSRKESDYNLNSSQLQSRYAIGGVTDDSNMTASQLAASQNKAPVRRTSLGAMTTVDEAPTNPVTIGYVGNAMAEVTDKSVERTPIGDVIGSRLLMAINEACPKSNMGVLILDRFTLKMINKLFKVSDIVDAGWVLQELLENKPTPIDGLEAVYLIQPSYVYTPPETSKGKELLRTSVDRVLENFFTLKKGEPMYAKVSIFFLSPPSTEQLASITKCRQLRRYLIEPVVFVNADFITLEDQLFTLDMAGRSIELFAQTSSNAQTVDTVAKRLVSVCSAMNEYPYIRFRAGNPLSGRIAALFQDSMESHIRDNSKYWYHGMSEISQRATIIFLDRTEDIVAPLLHQFGYQAMLADLFEVDGNKLKFAEDKDVSSTPASTDKTVGSSSSPTAPPTPGAVSEKKEKENPDNYLILKYNEEPFLSARHLHIAEATEVIDECFKELRGTEAGKLDAAGHNASMETLGAGLVNLNDYKIKKEIFQKHIKAAQKCFESLNKNKIFDLAAIEQLFVTGVDNNGDIANIPKKKTENVDKVITIIKDAAILPEDKARLLCIYSVTFGMNNSEMIEKLVEMANLPGWLQTAVGNVSSFQQLQGYIEDDNGPVILRKAVEKAKACKTTLKEQLERYEPKIKEIIEGELKGTLDKDQYPYIVEPPDFGELKAEMDKHAWNKNDKSPAWKGGVSARTARTTVRLASPVKKEKVAHVKKTGPRLIIFIAGGATYGELRLVHQLSNSLGRQVILGTTEMLNSKKYMQLLENIN